MQQSASPIRPAFCPGCGAAVTGDGRFCSECGEGLAADAVSDFSAFECQVCGGEGRRLARHHVYCPHCRWLKPLGPDYRLPVESYIWALDAQAMATLSNMGPVSAAAHSVSERFGRPMLEAAVNGVRLGPDQMPEVFNTAIRAARIIGLPRLPEIYVSGEQMWDCMTLGTDRDAFVVIGSVLINLKGDDLLYLLGREMGHVAAGHALWKTVTQFMTGRRQANRTIMGEGVLQFLNPTKIVESAIDAPLMAWARHSEITADRAGALVVGKEAVARRVAIQWTMKSFPIYQRLNIESLMREIDASDDAQAQASEWAMSSIPYLSRRLRLMKAFFAEESTQAWRAVIQHWATEEARPVAAAKPEDPNIIRLNCIGCKEPMRIPRSSLKGKTEAKVRCPNPACRKVLEVTAQPPKPPEIKREAPPKPPGARVTCPSCSTAMIAPLDALSGSDRAYVRCPNAECRKVLTIKAPSEPATPKMSPDMMSD